MVNMLAINYVFFLGPQINTDFHRFVFFVHRLAQINSNFLKFQFVFICANLWTVFVGMHLWILPKEPPKNPFTLFPILIIGIVALPIGFAVTITVIVAITIPITVTIAVSLGFLKIVKHKSQVGNGFILGKIINKF